MEPCRGVDREPSGRWCCAGDWNVVPEDRDVFSVKATQHDAVDAARGGAAAVAAAWSARAGPTR